MMVGPEAYVDDHDAQQTLLRHRCNFAHAATKNQSIDPYP